MLPGVPPTGRYVEVPLVAIVGFRGDKLCHEHIYWDQAGGAGADRAARPRWGCRWRDVETAQKVLDEALPSNTLMKRWAESAIGDLLKRASCASEQRLRRAVRNGISGAESLRCAGASQRRSQMASIPDKYLDLLQQKKAFANFLATVLKDGSPQVTPVWFDYTNGHVRVNTAKGRVKSRTLREGAHVAMAIMDPTIRIATCKSVGRSSARPSKAPRRISTRWRRSTSARTSIRIRSRAMCGSCTRSSPLRSPENAGRARYPRRPAHCGRAAASALRGWGRQDANCRSERRTGRGALGDSGGALCR